MIKKLLKYKGDINISMKKYKVFNTADEERKFKESGTGKKIIVKPGEFMITEHPPSDEGIWRVELLEIKEKKKKKIKKNMEDDN